MRANKGWPAILSLRGSDGWRSAARRKRQGCTNRALPGHACSSSSKWRWGGKESQRVASVAGCTWSCAGSGVNAAIVLHSSPGARGAAAVWRSCLQSHALVGVRGWWPGVLWQAAGDLRAGVACKRCAHACGGASMQEVRADPGSCAGCTAVARGQLLVCQVHASLLVR